MKLESKEKNKKGKKRDARGSADGYPALVASPSADKADKSAKKNIALELKLEASEKQRLHSDLLDSTQSTQFICFINKI